MPWAGISMFLFMVTGIFLIIIVLLQRGRGGGLAGALGGMGGQSAFGTKAGDVFTKITIVIAVIWVALAGLSGYALRSTGSRFGGGEDAEKKQIAGPDAKQPPSDNDADQPNAADPKAADPKAGTVKGADGESSLPDAKDAPQNSGRAIEKSGTAAPPSADAKPAAAESPESTERDSPKKE